MNTHRIHRLGALVGLLAVLGIVSMFASTPFIGLASETPEEETSTPTYEFLFEKAISDNTPSDPYTADEFTFHVTGDGVDETVALSAGTDSYASATALLPAGSYTVEEIGPDGFVYEDWTVQWSGYGCENGNGSVFETALTVTDDVSGNVCRADNQFRGEPEPVVGCTDPAALNYNPAAEEDDDSCEYEDDNGGGGGGSSKGTLIIVKNVINDNNGTSTPDMFSFTINGTSTTTFDGSGTTTLSLTPGTYTIEEIAASGYDVSYDNCTDVEVVVDGETTCTVTNDDVYDSNGGGHGEKTYKVYGYVWNDEDENDVKGEQEPYRESGITITATNGTDVVTTTTDEDGAYSFTLPAGTWTISQDKGDTWYYTYPNTEDATYTITIPQESEEDSDPQVSSLWGTIWNFLVPVAYAQEVEEYGPYNFGNVQRVQQSSGGGGGSSHSSGGGNSGGVDPVEEVAGAQTSVLPVGGAYAGAGGAATSSSLGLVFVLFALLAGGFGVRLAFAKA